MLQVVAKPDGFEIQFTEPLAAGSGNSSDQYLIQQWWYQPTKNYGGPKMDLETLKAKVVEVSQDRTRVRLEISGLVSKHVIYFELSDQLISASGQKLWSSEAWYTLNNIPQPIDQ
jgi:cytochrome c